MTSKGKLNARLVPIAAFLLLFIAVVAVNVLADFVPLRMDVTEEGLYTVSKGTREILGHIEDPVTLKLYYSQNIPDVPVAFTTYSNKVVELLHEYESSAPSGKVRLEIFDPAPDTETEEWANRYGLSPARLPNGTAMYFGLVAVSADREAIVPFFDPRRERFLEYDISEAISRVQQDKRPKLALISSMPIMGYGGYPMMSTQQMQGQWAIAKALSHSFDVDTLDPNHLAEIPKDTKLVLVIHPKRLPELAEYALDQFVMRGGRMVVLVDPNARTDQSAGGRFGGPTNSNLPKLFKAWGVKYDPMQIVGDQELATRVNTPNQGVVDYPIWLTVTPKYMNHDQVITSELEEMLMVDAGRFQMAKDSKLKFTPLVTSSPNSAMVDFTTVRVIDPISLGQMIKPDHSEKTLAALITGRFPSAFPDGPPPPPKADPKNKDADKPPKPTLPHLAKAEKESSVVLIGDVDFLQDQFSVRQVNFFGNVMSQPINDNLNLVLNSAEALAGSQALIHIRSRGKFSRPFTRVAALQVQAAAKYQAQEKQLSDKLDDVKKKLKTLEESSPQGEDVVLSDEQMNALKQYRQEEQTTRHALREVRKVLRQDIESLGSRLLAINLLAMPLLVAVGGFVVIYRRTRRSGGKR